MFDLELQHDIQNQKEFQHMVQHNISHFLDNCREKNNKSADITLYDVKSKQLYTNCKLVVNHTSDNVDILRKSAKYINDDFIASPTMVMMDTDSYMWVCELSTKTFIKYQWKNIIFTESSFYDDHCTVTVNGLDKICDKATFMEIVSDLQSKDGED